MKRLLDTMSRFKYITNAYANMARWIQNGDEETKKLKRYIHRYLAIPDDLPVDRREDAREVLMEFAFQYVSALLTYCSDNLKEGMLLARKHAYYTLAYTCTHSLQGIISCPSGQRRSSRNFLLARFACLLVAH